MEHLAGNVKTLGGQLQLLNVQLLLMDVPQRTRCGDGNAVAVTQRTAADPAPAIVAAGGEFHAQVQLKLCAAAAVGEVPGQCLLMGVAISRMQLVVPLTQLGQMRCMDRGGARPVHRARWRRRACGSQMQLPEQRIGTFGDQRPARLQLLRTFVAINQVLLQLAHLRGEFACLLFERAPLLQQLLDAGEDAPQQRVAR